MPSSKASQRRDTPRPGLPDDHRHLLSHMLDSLGVDQQTKREIVHQTEVASRAKPSRAEPDARLWLCRTALRYVKDRQRQDAPPEDPRAAAALATLAADAAPALPVESFMVHVVDLRRAMARLRRTEQELLWLAYVEGKSSTTIASQLGIAAHTVRQRLTRAARRLRGVLGPDYLLDDHGDHRLRAASWRR